MTGHENDLEPTAGEPAEGGPAADTPADLKRPTSRWLTPSRLVAAAWVAVGLQLVATVVSIAAERALPPDQADAETSSLNTVLSVTTAIHMGLFFAGAAGLFAGFLRGLGRSRYEELTVGGLFFLSGDTGLPGDQKRLLSALGAMVLIGFAGATAAPLTPVAFTALAPTAVFGCLALYGGYLGAFAELKNDSRVGA